MSDIRSFFGGGGSAKKPASAPAAPVSTAPPASTTKGKSPRKRVDEEDDFVLVDSDDEPTTKTNSQRKRLKNAKVEKEAATAAPAAAATATPTKKAPEVVDLADTPKEKLKKVAASPVKAKTPVKEEKPLLKPLKAASPPPSANKKAVANPFEFFGAPMPVEEEPKETLKAKKEAVTHVKKEATEEIKEVKSTPVKKRALPSSITSSGVKNESPVKKIAVESAESSPVPKSAPASTGMYFDNMRIGVTGVTRIMPREEMENYILENGGKLATSISGKTSMLVIGDVLEDGRAVTEGSKYRTAKEKKVKIVTEEEFLQMYDPATRPTLAAPPVVAAVPSTSSSAAKKSFGGSSVSQGQSGSSTTSSTKYSGPELNALWVDKYKPQSPSDLIGHGEMVRKFGDWLKGWHAIHIAKTVKPSFNKNENTSAKAVLLSGPPGIGKTSLAMTMATMFGYDILELNASDTRNKREIEDKLTEAVSTKAINAGSFMSSSSSNNNAAATKHRLVIMDEVDGMGGSDRGGVAELIKVIKLSKVPIVCICNDRQSQKIKSLANYCYDLRVKRPTKTQIAARLVSIAKAEGVTLEQNAAEMLVEQSGNDIRQALNALQMWSYGKAAPNKAGGAVTTGTSQVSYMSYSDVKAGIHRIEKDKVLRQSPFDACGMLLSGYHKVPSFDDRYNSFFIDYSLVPLLIQQNYVDASKSGVFRNPQLDDLKKLEMLSQASDAVSDVDMVGSLIRGQDQHWELLPTQATFCMRVGNPIVGFQAFPGFPQWLGKYSATNKKIRLTKELVQHSSLSIGQGFQPMRLDYVPYLRHALLKPLLTEGKDGVSATVSMLEYYGLTKEDFMESLKEMQFTSEYMKNFKDLYDNMDTQTKTALTKYYNTAGIKSSTVVPELAGMKKGKKARSSAAADDDEDGMLDEDAGEEVAEVEVEEEEDDVEALRAQLLKSKSSKAAAKAAKGGGGEAKATKGGGKKK